MPYSLIFILFLQVRFYNIFLAFVRGKNIEDRVFPESTPGKVLRGARGLKEMTQLQLARMAGVRPAHISDMENGRRTISREMAKKLGQALDFPYKAFL